MKITYTREEVTKIILAHVNKTVADGIFNTVQAADYNVFPRGFEVTFEAPAVVTEEVVA